jgi:hypothetical protein
MHMFGGSFIMYGLLDMMLVTGTRSLGPSLGA